MKVSTINGEVVCVSSIGGVSELQRYRDTGYTPEDIKELEEKYWMCNMQIALYDNELSDIKRLLCMV